MVKLRGIFYTMGGFFLVMLIVILSILVVLALQQSNDRLVESGSLERIYILDNSLEKIIKQMDDGITVNVVFDTTSNRTIANFTETLDTDFQDYGTNFYSEMQSLANFVESDQSEISFNLSTIYNSDEKVQIIAEPIDLKYTHLNSGGDNILYIQPKFYYPEARFYLVLPSSTGTDIQWTTQNPGDDFVFNITVEDKDGNKGSIQESLNSSLLNEFTVNSGIDIVIGDSCSLCISLDRGTTNVTSTTSIYFEYFGEMVTLNYPQSLYSINFSDLGVFLNGGPRIS